MYSYVASSSTTTILDYPYGELYDIDISYCYIFEDSYVAIGGTSFFSQDISNGVYIERTCLDETEDVMLPEDAPKIVKREDPIQSYYGVKYYYPYEKLSKTFYGTTTCLDVENVKDFNVKSK